MFCKAPDNANIWAICNAKIISIYTNKRQKIKQQQIQLHTKLEIFVLFTNYVALSVHCLKIKLSYLQDKNLKKNGKFVFTLLFFLLSLKS